MTSAVIATGASACVADNTPKAAEEIPNGFSNSIVAIGRGLLAESKIRDNNDPVSSKLPGTMVSLVARRPSDISQYFVTMFAQYRRNSEPWRDAPCNPDFVKAYGYDTRLRDVQKLSGAFRTVSLFIPDAAHFLRANVAVDIRMVIRFYRTNNQLVDGTEHALPHETVTPVEPKSRKTIEFKRPASSDLPPFYIYNIATGQQLSIG